MCNHLNFEDWVEMIADDLIRFVSKIRQQNGHFTTRGTSDS